MCIYKKYWYNADKIVSFEPRLVQDGVNQMMTKIQI